MILIILVNCHIDHPTSTDLEMRLDL